MGHRLLRSGVVASSCAAVVAGLLAGGVVPASAAVPSAVVPAEDSAVSGEGGVESVGPIPVVSGSGVVAPVGPAEVAVLPDGGVASGVKPFIAVPGLMDVSGSVDVRVVDASLPGVADGAVVWSGRMTSGWAPVGASLPAGGAYRVDVSADGREWRGVGWFVVRGAWAAGGSDLSVGAMSASQVSGGVSWGWSSPGLPGPAGMGSVSLGWSAGWAPPVSGRAGLPVGVPAGWRVGVGTGSPWASVLVSGADGIARVVGWDGSVLVFRRNADGVWVQVTGGAPGFSNELRRVDGSTWEFVSAQGVTTRFSGGDAVSGQQVFRVRSVFGAGKQWASVAWDDRGRVASVTNEVGRVASLSYAGASGAGCESSSWSGGWAAVPAGMLCAVSYPDGSSTQLGYVSGVAGDAQVGLVKDPGDVATTLGWDSRGRLVAERGAFANRVALVDASAKSVVTRVGYDASGRAQRVTLPSGAVQQLAFPNVSEQVLRSWVRDRDAAEPVTVSSTLVAGDFRLVKTSWLDPTSWVTLRSKDASGLSSRVEVDDRGRVSRMVDGLGRVTTYDYNDLGLVIGTTGPVASGKGTRTGQDFDTAGSGSQEKDLVGLRALVGSGANRQPEFWPASPARGGLSYAWSGRPADWAGQATGVWDPPAADQQKAREAGGWVLRVQSSGATVRVRVGSQVCEVNGGGECPVAAWSGDYTQVSVEITRGQPQGWFAVSAAPKGEQPKEITFTDVTPGYGLATVSSTNDVFPGRSAQPQTRSVFADPASGTPTQVTSPGGLVSRYSYEEGGWGRLVRATTAGGATQSTTYWPDNAQVSLPQVCGGGQVTVSGQMKSVTRQDKSTVQSWPDLSGRVVAQQLVGPGGDTQTSCTDYFADGSVRSSRVFNSAGALVEESTLDPAVGGDFRVTRTTVTAGPGAGDVALRQVWSQSTSNLLGQVVEATGSSGVVSRTTYNGLGAPLTVTTTAADGTRLVTENTYRSSDGQLASVSVNGVKAATLAYDSFARVASVTYPSGVQTSYAYDPAGRATGSTLVSGSARWSHRLDMTAFGRITGETLTRGGAADERRAYSYDPGTGRLAKATITSGTGASAQATTFDYGFGAESGTCAADAYSPGKDGLRTSGARDGTGYVTCYDAAGRATSTTDRLVTGGAAKAQLSYDGFGRVTAISGADPVQVSWGLGSSMTRLVQGGDDTATITMQDLAGVTLLRSVTTATGTSAVRYAGAFTLATDATGAPGAVVATQYGLPGGVQVSVAGGQAVATFPDLSGSAMATIALPALTGASGNPVRPGGTAEPSLSGLSASPRFGPYGEPLAAPSGGDGIKDYTWRAGMGLETLPGAASITVMGARPYHPGLGLFLTPDPVIDGGDALYSYTSGDPINYRDPSGGSEQSSWGTLLAMIGGGIAAVVAGGAAIGAFKATSVGGANAAGWISGFVGALAIAGGTYLAVTAGADSDTGLMIAGIAIAAAGAAAGVTGVVKGIKQVRALKMAPKVSIIEAAPPPAVAQTNVIAEAPQAPTPAFTRTDHLPSAEKLVLRSYEEHLEAIGDFTAYDLRMVRIARADGDAIRAGFKEAIDYNASPGSALKFHQDQWLGLKQQQMFMDDLVDAANNIKF
ncbi:MAG: RHS repeat-associated core domain-containing protein [Candidatus Nanopelagicales bacterium]